MNAFELSSDKYSVIGKSDLTRPDAYSSPCTNRRYIYIYRFVRNQPVSANTAKHSERERNKHAQIQITEIR